MKKKLMALLLVSALALSASACGNSSSKGSESAASSAKTDSTASSGTQSAKTDSKTASAGTDSATPMPTPELTDDEKALLAFEVVDTGLSADTVDELIELGEYKGLPLVVEEGATANIAFSGTVEGEDAPRDGMTSDATDLEIGSGSFIEGFEDALVGMKIGETREFDLAFPDPYPNNEDLSGKMTKWTVTINDIVNKEYYLLSRVTKASTIKAFPKSKYDETKEYVEALYKNYAENSGMEYDQFISMYGINTELETRRVLQGKLTSEAVLIKEGVYTADPLTGSESVYVDAVNKILSVNDAATVDDAIAAGIPKTWLVNSVEQLAAGKQILLYVA